MVINYSSNLKVKFKTLTMKNTFVQCCTYFQAKTGDFQAKTGDFQAKAGDLGSKLTS